MSDRPDLSSLGLRRVTLDDARMLYEWRHDAVVRANAISREPVPWDDHCAWLARKLASPDSRLWIFEYGGEPIGQLRCERNGQTGEVHYSLDGSVRGQGFGALMLQDAVDLAAAELGVTSVIGVVKKENTSSRRSFERAGFRVVSELAVDGQPCLTFARSVRGRRRRLQEMFRRLPPGLRYVWHRAGHHRRLATAHGIGHYLRWTALKTTLAARAAANASRYRVLNASELRAARRSDTVFIFGSGYSLNEITPTEWAHFSAHDVFGFSGFVHQRWVDVNFHLIRAWDRRRDALQRWRVTTAEYAEQLERNDRFAHAVLVMQADFTAIFSNALLGLPLLRKGRRIFRYRTARRLDYLPSLDLRDGLAHGVATLMDCVNLAYLMGWKRIVLVGVDLYDSRYFWGPADATLDFDERGRMVPSPTVGPGRSWRDTHLAAQRGLVPKLKIWADLFAQSGTSLLVYNPRSLLSGVLPIYERSPA